MPSRDLRCQEVMSLVMSLPLWPCETVFIYDPSTSWTIATPARTDKQARCWTRNTHHAHTCTSTIRAGGRPHTHVRMHTRCGRPPSHLAVEAHTVDNQHLACLPAWLSAYPSLYSSAYLSICLSACLAVCCSWWVFLSVCVCVSTFVSRITSRLHISYKPWWKCCQFYHLPCDCIALTIFYCSLRVREIDYTTLPPAGLATKGPGE